MNLDELDLLRFGRQLVRGNLLRQFQLPASALRPVQSDLPRLAVEVARRPRGAQVGVGIKQGLREVIPRRHLGEICDGETKGARAKNRDCARRKNLEVARQDLRRIRAGTPERQARFGIVRPREDDEQPAIPGWVGQALLDGNLELPWG